LAALGQTCRELLVAMFFDPAEPSYTDIAERLGRPVGSIGPTRARCLDKLRKALAPDV
jgi:DNA-directed RNA polymerase specialized sigma24 family protein